LFVLYLIEVTRHVCVAGFEIVNDVRQPLQTNHDRVRGRGVAKRSPGRLDSELIFGDSLGGVAFGQDGPTVGLMVAARGSSGS
jgi:hypothetical protein